MQSCEYFTELFYRLELYNTEKHRFKLQSFLKEILATLTKSVQRKKQQSKEGKVETYMRKSLEQRSNEEQGDKQAKTADQSSHLALATSRFLHNATRHRTRTSAATEEGAQHVACSQGY